MKNGLSLSLTLFLLVVSVCLAGCASTPAARFYTLTPLVAQETKPSSSSATNKVSVVIAPVEISDYLERPQIVTRDGRNELRLAEFDRWAGSLSDNIASVTAENLAQLLGTDRVFVLPRERGERPDYSVSMRVLRLDCVPGDQVLLKVQWTVFAGPERKDVATRVTTCTERVTDTQYATMVAAVSRTLEQVSREIARVINDRPKEGTPSPSAQVGP